MDETIKVFLKTANRIQLEKLLSKIKDDKEMMEAAELIRFILEQFNVPN